MWCGLGMDMMKMYFHGGYNEVILFDFWRISTLGGLIGSMIGCFILGILYEGLKFLREFLIGRELRLVIEKVPGWCFDDKDISGRLLTRMFPPTLWTSRTREQTRLQSTPRSRRSPGRPRGGRGRSGWRSSRPASSPEVTFSRHYFSLYRWAVSGTLGSLVYIWTRIEETLIDLNHCI